jgi:hypothetical protein
VHCPICAQALENGELVMVCASCHDSLAGQGSGLTLGATGEFRALTPEAAEATLSASGEGPAVMAVCAWCSKREHEVKKLLGRNGAALCDECVALASDIMDAELGETWRS